MRPLDPEGLPADRADAVAALDAWAGDDARNWRLELVRWFEAHAPVHLRPDATLNAVLRRAVRGGARLAVVSPLPPEAAELYLASLGVRRQIASLHGGGGGDGLAAARGALGVPDAPYLATREEVEASLTPAAR